MDTIHKIGRRKTAVARVYISKGKGNITVNDRAFDNYFTTGTLRYKVQQPLTLTNNEKEFDIKVNVYGGGITGQAEAIRLAISRAMCELNEENRGKLVRNSSSLNVNIINLLGRSYIERPSRLPSSYIYLIKLLVPRYRGVSLASKPKWKLLCIIHRLLSRQNVN